MPRLLSAGIVGGFTPSPVFLAQEFPKHIQPPNISLPSAHGKCCLAFQTFRDHQAIHGASSSKSKWRTVSHLFLPYPGTGFRLWHSLSPQVSYWFPHQNSREMLGNYGCSFPKIWKSVDLSLSFWLNSLPVSRLGEVYTKGKTLTTKTSCEGSDCGISTNTNQRPRGIALMFNLQLVSWIF